MSVCACSGIIGNTKTVCPAKYNCHRYTKVKNEFWQPYQLFNVKNKKLCPDFIDNTGWAIDPNVTIPKPVQ